jgi:teichuronic acid biosynthesis glycosyltransferase TuaC
VRALAPWVALEVVAPRPHTLPLPGFPFGSLARLPLRREEHGYVVHRPKYLYLVPKPIFYPYAGPAMARALVEYAGNLQPPDVIHAHWSYPDGWAARALRDHFGCKLVVHARGTLERVIAQQSSRFRALITQPLLAADAVIANSHALREDCLGLGVPAAKLHVIPNGVDLELFVPSDKRVMKRSLGLDPSRAWVLYCGNLRHVKGVDLLAEAIPRLRAARPELGFVLVGDGELRAALQQSLAAFLRDGSVIMTGALPQARVAQYMSAVDLLVLPSRSEARSNVIVEALACQTPIAAAAVGGIPEVVRVQHGRLFAPESSSAIVEAVLDLTGDAARLVQLGEAGRKFVLEGDMTWQAHAAHTLELYRSL